MSHEAVARHINQAVNAYMPGFTDRPLALMREGFSHLLDWEATVRDFSAVELKRRLAGASNLDVDQLRADAIIDEGVNPIIVGWLFDWLQGETVQIKRAFMQFVTGTPTLSVKKLKFSRKENNNMYPVGHTCMSSLELPAYGSPEELVEHVRVSVLEAQGFGLG